MSIPAANAEYRRTEISEVSANPDEADKQRPAQYSCYKKQVLPFTDATVEEGGPSSPQLSAYLPDEEQNMPVLSTRKANIIRLTCKPNFLHTALEER